MPIRQTPLGKRSRFRFSVLEPFLVVAVIVILLPVVWVVLSAFRPRDEIFSNPFGFPTSLYLDNIIDAWVHGRYGRYTLNTVIVTVPTLLIGVTCCSLAGYGLSIIPYKGAHIILSVFLLGMMLPSQALIITLFVVVRDLGLMNKYLGVILAQVAGHLPFGIFMMYSFFRSVSKEVIEASVIDGATTFQSYALIAMPMSAPALSTLAVFYFRWSWNSFIVPLLLIHKPDMRTVSLSLMYFTGRQGSDWALMAAGVTIMSLPVILVYAFLQRHFVTGTTLGALKF